MTGRRITTSCMWCGNAEVCCV